MPGSNMYGTPRQTYAVLNNVFYPADGNGLIANVAQADVQALVAQGCMSEAQWLKVGVEYVVRLYAPKDAVLNGGWAPPPVQKEP